MENGWKWPIYRWFTVLKNGGSFHGKLLGHNQRLDLPYVSTFGSGDHGHHIVSLRFCWTSWPFGMIKNGGSPGRQTSRNHCLVVPYSYNVRPPVDSVQLVNITPITMVYGTQITIVTGAYINQLITGGPHIVSILHGIWSLAWCHVTKYFPEELLYIYIYLPATCILPKLSQTSALSSYDFNTPGENQGHLNDQPNLKDSEKGPARKALDV